MVRFSWRKRTGCWRCLPSCWQWPAPPPRPTPRPTLTPLWRHRLAQRWPPPRMRKARLTPKSPLPWPPFPLSHHRPLNPLQLRQLRYCRPTRQPRLLPLSLLRLLLRPSQPQRFRSRHRGHRRPIPKRIPVSALTRPFCPPLLQRPPLRLCRRRRPNQPRLRRPLQFQPRARKALMYGLFGIWTETNSCPLILIIRAGAGFSYLPKEGKNGMNGISGGLKVNG